MTSDERAQLIEDIKKSDNLRRGIVERAELSEDFDILAAWEEVEKLDESIGKRIVAGRMNQWISDGRDVVIGSRYECIAVIGQKGRSWRSAR